MKNLSITIRTTTLLMGGILLFTAPSFAQEQQDPPKKVETTSEASEEAPKTEIRVYKAKKLEKSKLRSITPPTQTKQVGSKSEEETE